MQFNENLTILLSYMSYSTTRTRHRHRAFNAYATKYAQLMLDATWSNFDCNLIFLVFVLMLMFYVPFFQLSDIDIDIFFLLLLLYYVHALRFVLPLLHIKNSYKTFMLMLCDPYAYKFYTSIRPIRKPTFIRHSKWNAQEENWCINNRHRYVFEQICMRKYFLAK